MPEPRKPSVILPVAVAAIVLFAGYVGAYYWLVAVSPEWDVDRRPYYRGKREPVLMRLFAPMHRFDRNIRPHVWGKCGNFDLS